MSAVEAIVESVGGKVGGKVEGKRWREEIEGRGRRKR